MAKDWWKNFALGAAVVAIVLLALYRSKIMEMISNPPKSYIPSVPAYVPKVRFAEAPPEVIIYE